MSSASNRWAAIGAGFLLVAAGMAGASAQEGVPYASIASHGTAYTGPGREAVYDVTDATIRVGLLVPLHGPRKAEGDAILAAARLALDDASTVPLPGRHRLALVVADESGPSWGRSADALIRLVLDDQAVAVITSADGAATHLGEQVGNRVGVPILTLSTDSTTTQIDLPWIFRLGPSDAVQARILAQDIYRSHNFRSVLLVTERDHDGRAGGRDFQNSARMLGAPCPASLSVDPLQPDPEAFQRSMQSAPPQAIVFWTRSATARALLARIPDAQFHTPIYFSQAAAGEDAIPNVTGLWTVRSAAAPESFARRYQISTGHAPGALAAEAYDAVRLVAGALRATGANRARVRDRLAAVENYPGASGTISFDREGNNRAPMQLVRVR